MVRRLLKDPRGWIATGFGSGLAPKAPGTWGTLASLPFWALLSKLPWWVYGGTVIALFAIGVWAAQWVISELKTEDPGVIVIDEWVGMGVALAPLVYPQSLTLLASVFISFLLFRGFDIAKVWPVSWADKNLNGGFGAMLDDLLAGLWAALASVLLLWSFSLGKS
jgi:phosphatidylglycerophosphatase A